MPAYVTIECSFDKRDRNGLVRAFYDSFLDTDVQFDHVLEWGCDPNLTLDQIVEWNQSKLDVDFVLGYDEHVKNDFRQVVLSVKPFSECRLILANSDSGLAFHCIVPEVEINANNVNSLEQACRRVWAQLPVLALESYGELGESVGIGEIMAGQPPSSKLFAMIDYDCLQQGYAKEFDIKPLDRGYILKPKDL